MWSHRLLRSPGKPREKKGHFISSPLAREKFLWLHRQNHCRSSSSPLASANPCKSTPRKKKKPAGLLPQSHRIARSAASAKVTRYSCYCFFLRITAVNDNQRRHPAGTHRLTDDYAVLWIDNRCTPYIFWAHPLACDCVLWAPTLDMIGLDAIAAFGLQPEIYILRFFDLHRRSLCAGCIVENLHGFFLSWL